MKKAWNIIRVVLLWLIALVAIFMTVFTVIAVRNFDRNDRALFGYKMYIVNTDSMKKEFAAGDLIFVKEVDPNTLKEGDIITFISQSKASWGETVTHKIKEKTMVTTSTSEQMRPGFITYGTTTGEVDETPVTYPYVLGKYNFHIAGLGTFFNFVKTPAGYFVCIFIPFMLIIVYQGIKFFTLFRRYKREQLEAMQSERDKLEEERLANAKMLEELQALKAQLEGGQPAASTEETPTEEAPAEETAAEETPTE